MVTPETVRARNLAWYHRNSVRQKAQMKGYRARVKADVFEAYGGKTCICCGETIEGFLTIDHTNNDGNKHREEMGLRGGIGVYLWLKKNGFPSGFQVMCYNCNLGKARNNGICPHKTQQPLATSAA